MASARAAKAEQDTRERAADDDLKEMVESLRKSDWTTAKAAYDRAKVRLGSNDSQELRQRIDQHARELELAYLLENIRLRRADRFEPGVNPSTRAAKEYDSAFRNAGICEGRENPEIVASNIKATNIREALVAALDDWEACTNVAPEQKWILDVARRADRNTSEWYINARTYEIRQKQTALEKVIASAPATDQPVQLLLALAYRYESCGGNPIQLLTEVQKNHSSDFWVNYRLGEALGAKSKHAEAIRYYQAALALRQAGVVHHNLSIALLAIGRLDEAKLHMEETVKYDPLSFTAQYNLGLFLLEKKDYSSAIEHLRLAVKLEPKAITHAGYAAGLFYLGKYEEAYEEYRKALALDPNLISAQKGVRTAAD
ncbi:MAG: tetratricopeptide repeat protein [Gemmatales bacterium]